MVSVSRSWMVAYTLCAIPKEDKKLILDYKHQMNPQYMGFLRTYGKKLIKAHIAKFRQDKPPP